MRGGYVVLEAKVLSCEVFRGIVSSSYIYM